MPAEIARHAAIAELGLGALARDGPTLMARAVDLVARTLAVDLCRILEVLPQRQAHASAHRRCGGDPRDVCP